MSRLNVKGIAFGVLLLVGCMSAATSDPTGDPTISPAPSTPATPTPTAGAPSSPSRASFAGSRVTGVAQGAPQPSPTPTPASGPNVDWNVATGAPVTLAPATAGVSFMAGAATDVFGFGVNGTSGTRGITAAQVTNGYAGGAASAGLIVLTNLYQTHPDLLAYALSGDTTNAFASGGIVFNIAGTALYALSTAGNLFCYTVPAGGSMLGKTAGAMSSCTGWTNYSGGNTSTYSSPWPVYDASGTVTQLYFGDDQGYLHCVNGTTGASCWGGGAGQIQIVTTSPLGAPIAVNGVVYVGDSVGRFYRVIDVGSTPSNQDGNTASYDLCGGAPGTCASNPWAVTTSPTIDLTYNTAYIAAGGEIFQFPVGSTADWQPTATAKILVAGPGVAMASNPVLDSTNLWLYVGFNNRLYKVKYPFDGNASTGIYSSALQRAGADASYPHTTPLPFSNIVYVGTGNGANGWGEQYSCTGATNATDPGFMASTANNYGQYVPTAMVVDYITGNVNFGYQNGASAGGVVQFPAATGGLNWTCPSTPNTTSQSSCAVAGCATKCSSVACPGTNVTGSACGGTGICTGSCSAGFLDCNSNLNLDGCEINKNTDPLNCSACGTACSTNNITPTCAAGVCGGTCNSGFADCNHSNADGCEATVTCGNCCGAVCGAGKSCSAGTCQATTLSACGTGSEHQDVTLTCPAGTHVTAVTFASFGTPNGTCGGFTTSACDAGTSVSVVSTACMGMTSCTIPAEDGTFGDPCTGTFKRLYVQLACSC